MRVLLLVAAIVVPILAHAEPAKIGVITFVSLPAFKAAFSQGLREQGLVEGKDVVVDYRSADGSVDRADKIAAEFVQAKVSVIVASLTSAVGAASKATKTIPIVMAPVADPVGTGFVKSLSRPGGNITGISNVVTDVGGKLLGLVREVQPSVTRVAVIVEMGGAAAKPLVEEAQAAGAKTGMRILPVWIKSAKEVAEGFKAARKEGAQAVMIQPLLASKEVAELARQYRLPSISTGFAARAYPRAGGLIGYGSDPTEHFRRAAFYVSRILRGAKAGDLPVEQSTIFELVVNVKTAKAIGLTIPKDMLVRAIEVIE